MAYTYHDWREQTTDAARLTRLRQHMTEVSAGIAAAVSDGGASRDSSNLTAYLDQLKRDEADLMARTAGSFGYIRRGRVGR